MDIVLMRHKMYGHITLGHQSKRNAYHLRRTQQQEVMAINEKQFRECVRVAWREMIGACTIKLHTKWEKCAALLPERSQESRFWHWRSTRGSLSTVCIQEAMHKTAFVSHPQDSIISKSQATCSERHGRLPWQTHRVDQSKVEISRCKAFRSVINNNTIYYN